MTDYIPSNIEIERKNRIRLSVAAYAYEFESESIMSDSEFDELAKSIRPKISTLEPYHRRTSEINRIKRLDKFFLEEFSADTGMWIHKHPELDRLKKYFHHLKNKGIFSS
jgi:hypothetical protein